MEKVRRSIVTLPLSSTNMKTDPVVRANSFKVKDFQPTTIQSVVNLTPLGSMKSQVLMGALNF